MGQEAKCTASVDGREASGKASIESERLIFRSPEIRFDIPFREIEGLRSRGGALHLTHGAAKIVIELGPLTSKWEEKIRKPTQRIDKLGVKCGMRVALVGIDDKDFLREIEAKGADVTLGRAGKMCDLIFYGAASRSDLSRLDKLKGALKPAGALWIIRPKGVTAITEADAMAGGKAAGLVDVKVASFSPTHTAEKFVIPLSARPKP